MLTKLCCHPIYLVLLSEFFVLHGCNTNYELTELVAAKAALVAASDTTPNGINYIDHKYILIEFEPEEDKKIKIIADHKNSGKHPYDKNTCDELFSSCFLIHHKQVLKNGRVVYLIENQFHLSDSE